MTRRMTAIDILIAAGCVTWFALLVAGAWLAVRIALR